MEPRDVKTPEQALELVKSRNCKHVKIAITDFNGILRGKYISLAKFESALKNGMGFCDVVLGIDTDDQLINNLKTTGWHTGYPDAPIKIDPSSCREIPFEENTLLFLCEFDEDTAAVCPRQLLKRVIQRANDMGFFPYCAFEYEFTVFNETMESVREKYYRNLKPITPDNFGYSIMRNTFLSEFYHDLLSLGEQMDFPIEGFHTEIGPGVLEAALVADSAVNAADKANLFKTMTKVYAEREGLMANFMAKWNSEMQGQSGHFHISLLDKNGNNVFYDEKTDANMSQTMRQFVAGQQALMPEWLVLAAPTINSFARLVPGFWAPTSALWGIDNRTTALRAITGSKKAQRVEYRIGAADTNPYLLAASAIASGLYGIEHDLTLGKPTKGNAYAAKVDKKHALPTTLEAAANRFSASTIAHDYFGETFVHDFSITRLWEVREYQKAITDWQMQRYFEII